MFKIHLLAFLIAFSFGLISCYVMAPTPKLVMKFPSPQNAGNILYRDNADTCFTFRADRVKCTKNAKSQPILQHTGGA